MHGYAAKVMEFYNIFKKKREGKNEKY